MADRDYLVTARKYRPSLFKELVAQEHVTDTLKNALRLDRLAHAYLFSGPRGVGKTTAARILAKAINCETPREEREDGAEPCCECDSCTSFEEGRSLNVFEMDAASNNKVDDVRDLREKVRIPPQGDRKKVYILDEVHMLSKQAFNALLKTLEEPPAHALFIFATTEPHKVLPTILSRCQRFDFRRIPVPKMVDRLREICETEGVEADEESLMLLARKGNGALRDALSAFDQAISLCGKTLAYGELTQALGVVDQDLYFDLTDHVATQNTAGVLELVREVVRSGYDLQEFLVGLAEHLRNLLVARSLGGEALAEVAESTRVQYAEEAQRFGEADLLRLLTIAGDAQDEVKNSPQPRLKLETTLLKMAQMRRAADLQTVLQKIDRLEQMAEEGELPASLAAPTDDTADSSRATDSSDPASAETQPTETQNAKAAAEEAAAFGADEVADEPAEYGDQDAPEWGTDDATGPWGGPDGGGEGAEPPRYIVDNVPVTVLAERVQYLDGEGQLITESLTDYTRKRVKEQYASLSDFLRQWQGADRKQAIIDELAEQGVFWDELIREVGDKLGEEPDPFAVICHIVYDQPPLSRRQRAENVRKQDYFQQYSEPARQVLDGLLEKYADTGIEPIEDRKVLTMDPLSRLGTATELIQSFGGKSGYDQAVRELEDALYDQEA